MSEKDFLDFVFDKEGSDPLIETISFKEIE